MIGRILRFLFGDETFYECRSCGNTLETDRETCPKCDSEAIAKYDWK